MVETSPKSTTDGPDDVDAAPPCRTTGVPAFPKTKGLWRVGVSIAPELNILTGDLSKDGAS